MKKITFAALIILCLPAVAHAAATDRLKLEGTRFNKLKGWEESDHFTALTSFRNSCKSLLKLPTDTVLGWPARMAGDWKKVCKLATNPDIQTDRQAKHYFEDNFRPYKATDIRGSSKALFTGYYEPQLHGSRKVSDKFKYPLYKLPDDLKRDCSIKRADIENGALNGKNLELIYIDDPIEAFFLHVQGSGRINLDDGKVVKVGFAGKNGCDYTAIGKYLMEIGEAGKGTATVPKIKEWLKKNPERMREVLNKNESFIFFKEIKSEVIGGQGVPLTPMHSLAIDREYIPYSIPIWVNTTLPDVGGGSEKLRNLMIAQDTGSGLEGPLRGDIFFGYSKKAEVLAGSMKQEGEMYLLLPKNIKIY